VHRFYNPDLSASEIEALDWSNWLTLQTVQAFLGSISDNFLGVAAEPRRDAVNVHVALRDASEIDEAAISDALSDLDVLLEGKVTIDHTIVLEVPDMARWRASGLRLVFLRTRD
jgi:hypothetical protein